MTRPVVPVTVITPAHNNAATIGRALASIAAQTVAPVLVVVVDDGSLDDTGEIARTYQARLEPSRLLVLTQENAGAGAARNAAIARSEGTFLAFLDADDEWMAEKLERSLKHLDNSDIVFVSHDMEVRHADGTTLPMDCARHYHSAPDPFIALMRRGFVATSTVVARRDVVQAHAGFAPHLRAAQDYDLWLRLAESGSFKVFSAALTRYHVNSQGITANVETRRRCSLAVLDRHLGSLHRHSGAWSTLFLRTAVIHYEAMSAHLGKGAKVAAIWSAMHFPYCLIRVLILFLLRCPQFRKAFQE